MKKLLLVSAVVMMVCVSVSPVWACAGRHGANVASGLNAIFGSDVAEGDAQGRGRGGDHGVFVQAANGATMQASWTQGQRLYDFLVSNGSSPAGNSNEIVNNASRKQG